MSLNASDVGGNRLDYPNLEPGTYPGRLRGVVNAGLHPQRVFQGQEKPPAHDLILIWELVDEFLPDEGGQPDESKPRNLSETMPFHSLFSERAKSTMRYKALDPKGEFKGDWSKLINTPATVMVVNNESKGRVYDNVGDILPMRAAQAKLLPSLVNPTIIFDTEDPDPVEWSKLPKWIQKKCQENLEFKGSKLEKMLDTGAGAGPGGIERDSNPMGENDDTTFEPTEEPPF